MHRVVKTGGSTWSNPSNQACSEEERTGGILILFQSILIKSFDTEYSLISSSIFSILFLKFLFFRVGMTSSPLLLFFNEIL